MFSMNYFRSVFGIVFALIMVAGFTSLVFSEYVSPRVQLESGVAPEDIMCKEDRILAIRENGSPACVTEKTSERMGWEIISVSHIKIDMPLESSDDLTIQDEPTFNIIPDNLGNNIENSVNIIPIAKEKIEIDLSLHQVTDLKPIPRGTLESAIQISPKDVDEFANKIATLFDDEITNREERSREMRYETERGEISVDSDKTNFIGFGYVKHSPRPTSFAEGEKIFEEMLKEFGIVLDGTEFKQFYTNAQGQHSFKYIQKKDGIYIPTNLVYAHFNGGFDTMGVRNWNNNLSELDLIDLDKAQQIGIDYTQTFEILTEPPCDIKMEDRPLYTDEISHTTLEIINATPIYVVYSGTCQMSSALQSQDFETVMNASTGEILNFNRGPSM